MKRLATVLAVGIAVLVAAPAAEAEDKVPFHDLQTKGGLALCDGHGHALSSGSTHDKPFVEKAVSSYRPDSHWTGEGRSAVLYAYQPRKDAYPDQWNGDTLTAASAYDGRPTAIATQLDFTLEDYLKEFPATWDGLVQLRLYWGAQSVGFDQREYASVVLKVEGDRWRAIDGIEPGCDSGKARSTEVSVAGLDPSASASPHAPGAGPSSSAHHGASTGGGASGSRDAADAASSSSGQGGQVGRSFALIATGIAVAALLALGGRAARRLLLAR